MEKYHQQQIEPFAQSIIQNQLLGYNCAYLVQTTTSLSKSTIDSNEKFRLWADRNQIVGYDDLERGDQGGKTVDAFFFDVNVWLDARVKFYRSNDPRRNDRRLSIHIDDEGLETRVSRFKEFVEPGDVLFFFEVRRYIYMFTLNQKSDPETTLANDVLQEMLDRVRLRK